MLSALALTLFLVPQIVGAETVYSVKRGDSLTSIGARFGVATRVLAEANGLDAAGHLKTGDTLKIDNRHIVPSFEGSRIVVNIPQRMLFWFKSDDALDAFPVAAGRRSWKTPTGDFTVVTRETDPTWDVPISIQEEMRKQGKPVLTHVPPSPANPLGKHWIGLSIPGVGVHGTNQPSSIYGLVTHACIRLHPEDIETLFPQVAIGMRGKFIYEPVLVTRVGNSVFVEVHEDAYGFGADPLSIVMERARTEGYVDMLNLPLLREVIRRKDGIARDVTR
jgi:L,D-transpeptidase ErfK/SrfK